MRQVSEWFDHVVHYLDHAQNFVKVQDEERYTDWDGGD